MRKPLDAELRNLVAAARSALPEVDSRHLVPGSFWDSVGGPLSKFGLWIDQRTELRRGHIRVTTTLIDAAGENRTISLSLDDTIPKGCSIGRAIAELELRNAVDLIAYVAQSTIDEVG